MQDGITPLLDQSCVSHQNVHQLCGGSLRRSTPNCELLTDMLQCEISEETGDFVRLFTDGLDTVSSSLEHNESFVQQTVSSPMSSNVDDYVLNQVDIQRLDNELQDLPKDFYITKLMDMCSDDDRLLVWYRNVLSTRARKLEGCPDGNLINRKTTTKSTSAKKYAHDCHTLYLFLQGDKSGIDTIFDKKKSTANNLEVQKIPLVDIRVSLQSLLQRVNKLEHTIQDKNKIIDNLNLDLAQFKTKHEKLQKDYENIKSNTESKFSKYDSMHKLSTQQFKRLETDYTDIRKYVNKTDDEIKRLSKVSSGLQKQINSKLSPVSYANAVSSPVHTHTPSDSCVKATVNSKKSDPNSASDKSRHNLEKPSTKIVSSNPCTTLFTVSKKQSTVQTPVSQCTARSTDSTSQVNQADSGTRLSQMLVFIRLI